MSQAALDKAYNPQAVQEHVAARWQKRQAHHAVPDATKPPYAIVIPPPNVTAALHMGHALNNTIQDILIRWRRMAGDNAVWIPGTDHAGIATQTVVDKRLQAEGEPALKNYKKLETEGRNGREQFIAKVQAWKDEYEARITHQLKEMGSSCDWDRQRFTMDPVCTAAVREAFFQLFKAGLIYRGKRLVNWDPVTQTALADDEVEMKEVDGHFYYMRYPLADGSGHVTVATTRPETMLGDTAVAINPKDPRAADLKGKKVRLPIVNREIPILEDDYVVLPVALGGDEKDPKAQMATGFLKVTPAHDPNDWEIGQRHSLPAINVMAPDASISDQHGWPADDVANADEFLRDLIGLSREDAREAIVQWFKEHELLEEVKPHRHSVGHSYRSHVAIEPYLSDQWYVKVTDDRLAGAALKAMSSEQRSETGEAAQRDDHPFKTPAEKAHGLEPWRSGTEGQLRFHPPRYAKTFQSWHENIRDWCISRQLWWGHRIPVWRGWQADMFDRSGDSDSFIADERFVPRTLRNVEVATQMRSEGTNVYEYVCVPPGHPEIENHLERLGYVQDPDVLDTWFSSALWPISTLGWPNPEAFADEFPEGKLALETWNPSSTLCTAREIITLWVSRMVMFNLFFRGCLPFKDVFIHAMIQDGEGQKMSKSLGNGVDPLDVIHTHGADAMRFTLASMTTQTQDVRMPVDVICPFTGESFTPKKITTPAGHVVAAPVQECPSDPSKKMVTSYGYSSGMAKPTDDMPLARNTSAKFDLGRNFANKLWNAARFVLGKLEQGGAETGGQAEFSTVDRWILTRLGRTIRTIDSALAGYEFKNYADAVYDFFWRDYCDWYLEAIKPIVGEASPAGAGARAVAAACLDATLRLLHPVMPYVTEGLWDQLAPARGQQAVPGLQLPDSELCMLAPWPKADDSLIDGAAREQFELAREVIGAIRNVRNQYNVPPRQSTTVAVKAGENETKVLDGLRSVLQTLATSEVTAIGPDLEAPGDAATSIVGNLEIYVHGLIDPDAERTRLTKRLEELSKSRGALAGRLNNPGYVQKAPAHLVQQTRDQLADVEREITAVEAKLTALA